jgi:hypothetical protein
MAGTVGVVVAVLVVAGVGLGKQAMARRAEAEREKLAKIVVDKNTAVVFPAPLMSTVADLGVFLQREGLAAEGYGASTPAEQPTDAGRGSVAANRAPTYPLTGASVYARQPNGAES